MKKYILVVIIFCLLKTAGAQSTTSLISRFDSYQSIWPKVKLHLVFNQEKFSPGDTAYFKIYFLNDDLSVVKDIQLVDVNLVDSKGEPKVHFLVKVDNGLANNQLVIPNDLPPGLYFVTAHSSWMKNFDIELIFKKQIEIVRSNMLSVIEERLPRAVVEGGHLVRDVSNRVSIITYRPGSTLQVVDDAGQEIERVTTDLNGIGSVIFKPNKERSYFVKVDGLPNKISLPVVENDGFSVMLTSSAEGSVKVLIAAPEGSVLRNEEISVLVSARGKVGYSTSFVQGGKESVELQIPRNDLPEGIAHVSLLTKAAELKASRDFYNDDSATINAKIESGKGSFQTREKIKIDVALEASNGQPVTGEFSVRVINEELLGAKTQNLLRDELNVLSGLKEWMLIDRADPNWSSNLDNFLIANTEEVPWKKIISGEKPRYPFTSTIQRKGRAFYAASGEPLPDRSKVLFYLQKDLLHYETFTLDQGKVQLTLPDIYGEDEFFYLSEEQYFEKEIPDPRIEWESESIQLPHTAATKESDRPDPYATFVTKRKLIERSYGYYSITKGDTIKKPSGKDLTDFENEIAEADVVIRVEDYTPFPTMSDLVKEVIPSLRRRTRSNRDVVLVSLSEPMKMPVTEPVFIIDGIATRSSAFFLSLKPSDVVAVKVINTTKKLLPLGLLGKTGIVIVQTRNGNARESQLDPSRVIEGLNRPVDFREVSHSESGDLRIPDFRATIYWNPSVKMDPSGKSSIEFYGSDDIGKLMIRVDGFAGGKPFTIFREIEVLERLKN